MNAPLLDLEPGIHEIPMEQYLALPYLSSGLCKTILQHSPFHAKHDQDHPDIEDDETADCGTAIHDALLEGVDRIQAIKPEDHRSKPNKANPEGAIPKGWTNNAIKAARDMARAAGKIPMLADEVDFIKGAVQAASTFIRRTKIAHVFDTGKPELTIIWREGDVLCKARPDWLTADHSILLHVKTTKASAGPLQFGRIVDSMGYDVSLAFYERALASVSDGAAQHLILAIEQQKPWGCALYDLAPAKAEIAAAQVEHAIAVWQRCAAAGRWPSYATRIHSLEPKPWQLQEHEERVVSRAFTKEELSAGIPL